MPLVLVPLKRLPSLSHCARRGSQQAGTSQAHRSSITQQLLSCNLYGSVAAEPCPKTHRLLSSGIMRWKLEEEAMIWATARPPCRDEGGVCGTDS